MERTIEGVESPGRGSDGRRLQGAWRAVLWLAVGCAAAWFAWANRSDLPEAWRVARGASPAWLLACAAWVAVFLAGQVGMYASTRRAVGLESSWHGLVVPSLAAGALNIVSKSGGMGGLAVFLAEAKRRGEPTGTVATAYTGVVAVSHATFALTLAAVFGLVWLDGSVTRVEVAAGAVFGVYLAVQAAILGAAVWSRAAVRRVYWLAGAGVHGLRRLAGLTRDTYVPNTTAADDVFEAISLLRSGPFRLAGALGWGMLTEVAGVGLLWTVLRALGETTGLAPALVGYAMTVLFSTVSVLPAGLGTAEASLGALLHSYGVEAPMAATAVVLYRIGEAWIPLAAGLVALRLLRRGGKEQ